MIINTASLAALFQSYSALFARAFAGAPTTFERVATVAPSGSAANIYAFLGQFPSLRKWLGDRHVNDLKAFGYTIANEPFESTIAVPKPTIEDDQYGTFGTMIEDMGYAAKTHPDTLVYALLQAAASTLCYDGGFMASTTHPTPGMESAATSNYDATPGTVRTPWFLMDTTRPLKPVIFQKRQDYQFQAMTSPNDDHVFKRNEYLYGVDARVNVGFGVWQALYMSLNNLTDVNFEAALASMMSLRGDGVNSDVKSGKVLGQPLGLKPNLLVVGPSRRAEANKLIERERLDSGASNPNWKAVEVLITPYLP